MRRIARSVRWRVVLAACFVVLAGCSRESGGGSKKPAMSERTRDSIMAKSKLPGAGIVGKALEVSDSTAARAARIDSAAR